MNKHNDTSIGICPACGGNLFLTAGKILCYNCDYITNAGTIKKKSACNHDGAESREAVQEQNKKQEEPTMKVSYNGFTGELVKLEQSKNRTGFIPLGKTIINEETMEVSYEKAPKLYDLSIYDAEKKVTNSFTSVNLKDVKFLGGSVSFD